MNRQPKLRWERVADRLRRNDPGAERPLDPQEQREIRRRMLTHLRERHPVAWWRWNWRLVAPGSLIVVAGVVWWGLESSQDVLPRDETVAHVAGTAAGSRGATVELRFVASEGTQLVWILQTDREN